ncbi:MAG: helix-turn-helix domain-containing protein, partial [Thermoplasmata archaeon]
MKRITVNDKILWHLLPYLKYNQEYEMPVDITQDGIARRVGISRGHVAVSIGELKKRGMIEERLSRVRNVGRQRKVYFLTSKGTLHIRALIRTINKKT